MNDLQPKTAPLPAAAMIADWRTNPRAASGTSSNLSTASIFAANGSIHSGGFNHRSRPHVLGESGCEQERL